MIKHCEALKHQCALNLVSSDTHKDKKVIISLSPMLKLLLYAAGLYAQDLSDQLVELQIILFQTKNKNKGMKNSDKMSYLLVLKFIDPE